MAFSDTMIMHVDTEIKRAMNVQSHIEAVSRNYFGRGKTIIIKYSECVTLVIQHAKRIRYIFICVLSGCAIFFHLIT